MYVAVCRLRVVLCDSSSLLTWGSFESRPDSELLKLLKQHCDEQELMHSLRVWLMMLLPASPF